MDVVTSLHPPSLRRHTAVALTPSFTAFGPCNYDIECEDASAVDKVAPINYPFSFVIFRGAVN